MANITLIFNVFLWFFYKNQTFSAIFITMTQLYSKMGMSFGISVQNCMKPHIIEKNYFSAKSSPLGEGPGGNIFKKESCGGPQVNFSRKTILFNYMWFHAVLNVDSE